MGSVLMINALGRETRVALVEDGSLVEFHIERAQQREIVGNIYKGKVERVLPGMNAAFVNIGLEKSAFLTVSDVVGKGDFEELRTMFEDDVVAAPAESGEEEAREAPPKEGPPPPAAEAAASAGGETSGAETSGAETSGGETSGGETPAEAHPEGGAEKKSHRRRRRRRGGRHRRGGRGRGGASSPQGGTPPAPGGGEEPPPPTGDLPPPGEPNDLGPTGAPAGDDESPIPEPPAEPQALAPEEEAAPSEPSAGAPRPPSRHGRHRDRRERHAPRRSHRIQDVVHPGQDIVVQVAKSEIGTKGARITTRLALPGRYLVFMPGVHHIGISRRIGSGSERNRLRKILQKARHQGGFIIRTASEGATDEEIQADMEYLLKLWEEILRREQALKSPALLFQELDLTLKTLRDLLTRKVEKVLIDSEAEYLKAKEFAATFFPDRMADIERYTGEEPIFDQQGVDAALGRALQKKVDLKSGGYIIIDELEALTAIDVNTGKFVGRKNQEETILRTNLEAAEEVVRQLRLRNIGGLIVVDFIDMDRRPHRDQVFHAISGALRKDKARTNIVNFSEFGVIQITRKRTHESLLRALTESCNTCKGSSVEKSPETVCYDALRQVMREARKTRGKRLFVRAHPRVSDLLLGAELDAVQEMEARLDKQIVVKPKQSYGLEDFDVTVG